MEFTVQVRISDAETPAAQKRELARVLRDVARIALKLGAENAHGSILDQSAHVVGAYGPRIALSQTEMDRLGKPCRVCGREFIALSGPAVGCGAHGIVAMARE